MSANAWVTARVHFRRYLKEIFKTVISLARVIVRSHYQVSMPRVANESMPCLVFGNGPSLTEDVCEKIDLIKGLDIFCVGHFAESDLYKIVQPKYYVFADPTFWFPDAPSKTILTRARLFDRIISDTSWPLSICAPFEAREFLIDAFSGAPNISLLFYNNVPLYGMKRIVNMLYDHNLGMPHVQNVLVASLFLALRMGYAKIIMLGADHSWHETLALDEANRVCLRDRHFYDQDARMQPFEVDGTGEEIFTMGALFHALGAMFEGYWNIAEYAKRQNAQIINASSVTYIDAFRRKKLPESLTELFE